LKRFYAVLDPSFHLLRVERVFLVACHLDLLVVIGHGWKEDLLTTLNNTQKRQERR